jgi:SnoaL-like domain
MKMRFSLNILAVTSLLLPLFNALSTWKQIHQTIHTYPLAIDRKNFSLLREVFTPNAFANYTGPLSSLTGLQAIETALTVSVANVLSQHLLGTIVIDIHKDQKSANSTTYFQASLFSTGTRWTKLYICTDIIQTSLC